MLVTLAPSLKILERYAARLSCLRVYLSFRWIVATANNFAPSDDLRRESAPNHQTMIQVDELSLMCANKQSNLLGIVSLSRDPWRHIYTNAVASDRRTCRLSADEFVKGLQLFAQHCPWALQQLIQTCYKKPGKLVFWNGKLMVSVEHFSSFQSTRPKCKRALDSPRS